MRRVGLFTMAALLWSAAIPSAIRAAQGDEPYARILSDHFDVSLGEVSLLVEDAADPDEVAVVLRLAQLSGVSPSPLLAQRRAGESWAAIARRYEIGSGSFHVPLPEEEVTPDLERPSRLFTEIHPSRWDAIELRDHELIALVNLGLLTEALGVPYGRVLDARAASSSYREAARLMAGLP